VREPWGASVLFTCEHASNALPPPYEWPQEDEWVRSTHWAWDPGARDFALECAERFGGVYVGACFSRLLCDVNRPIASDTMFRERADGAAVKLNRGMTDEERDRRIASFYVRYHRRLGQAANAMDPRLIVSCHSFTPEYEGEKRDMDMGVLCTHEDALARSLVSEFCAAGLDCRENAPWSGKEGFMYSADSLAVAAPVRRTAIMLELRNDLAVDPAWRERVTGALKSSLAAQKSRVFEHAP
jgi:predicted N-formylglutamate amidohydrolase